MCSMSTACFFLFLVKNYRYPQVLSLFVLLLFSISLRCFFTISLFAFFPLIFSSSLRSLILKHRNQKEKENDDNDNANEIDGRVIGTKFFHKMVRRIARKKQINISNKTME